MAAGLLEQDDIPAPAALSDASPWRVNVVAAHCMYAQAICRELEAIALPPHCRDPCAPQVPHRQYALRHALSHVIAAGAWQQLHRLVCGCPLVMKAMAEEGHLVAAAQQLLGLKASGAALAALGPQGLAELLSVGRFLRADMQQLQEDPHSFLSEALSSPSSCALYRTLRALQVPAGFWAGTIRLQNPPVAFPPLLDILEGHASGVNTCAISRDGTTLVSGSDDCSLKVWDLSSGQLRATLLGHNERVTACAIAPDGVTLVSVSDDNTLKVWNLASGQLRTTLEGHGSYIEECMQCETPVTEPKRLLEQAICTITPDGMTLVSSSDYRTVNVWDLPSGRLRTTWEGHRVTAVSPDGRIWVLVSDDGVSEVWDMASGQLRTTLDGLDDIIPPESVPACTISLDGTTLVSSLRAKGITVWDLTSGQVRATLKGCDNVEACAISQDCVTLATGYLFGHVKFWDVASGELRTTLSCTDFIDACAISPDCGTLVTGHYSGDIKVWNLASGELRTVLSGHENKVRTLAVSLDGATLFSGSQDGTLRVWDLASCQADTAHGHSQRVNACVISPDGATVVSGSEDRTAKIWDLASGQLRTTLDDHRASVYACAISADGTTLVTSSGCTGGPLSPDHCGLMVWDLASGQRRFAMQDIHDSVTACAISPDSLTLAFASCEKGLWPMPEPWRDEYEKVPAYHLHVFDMASSRLHTIQRAHDDRINVCAFSPDNTMLMSVSSDCTVKAWDPPTGQLRNTLLYNAGGVNGRDGTGCAHAFCPNGKTLVFEKGDRTLEVLDFKVLDTKLRTRLHGHDGGVTACAITLDRMLLLSGSEDRTLKMWDLASGQLRTTLQVHDQHVTASAISQDGATLVSGSADGTIRVCRFAGCESEPLACYSLGSHSIIHRQAKIQGIALMDIL